MKRAGVIGLGDMGSGLAKNLIKAGHPTSGFDVNAKRLAAFKEQGGNPAASPREVAENADAVFIMVMNGGQAKSVIFGEDGLLRTLRKGSVILMTATIRPVEMREIAADLKGSGIGLVDTPVSGGYGGAHGGTLTLMAAADQATFDSSQDVMGAIGKRIFYVGEEPGMGQTVKACLQALIGSVYSATFEAAVLAAKSGIEGKVMFDVFTASSAGSVIVNNALQKILDRTFVGTGSHISTMYKDLTISLEHALDVGVPVFTAAAAMQLFRAGKSRFPDEDNWTVTKVLEEIAGTEVVW